MCSPCTAGNLGSAGAASTGSTDRRGQTRPAVAAGRAPVAASGASDTAAAHLAVRFRRGPISLRFGFSACCWPPWAAAAATWAAN
ncbi:MAG: hypothetical protein C0504_01335 [Candidatus Solibacter sp.]|nr:hypothetical protein [Candidatus Solibacter sp.]